MRTNWGGNERKERKKKGMRRGMYWGENERKWRGYVGGGEKKKRKKNKKNKE